MMMQPEHKPLPWDKVAAENTSAARLTADPQLTGLDPAFDADVLRIVADLDPGDLARFASPPRPDAVINLLSHPIP